MAWQGKGVSEICQQLKDPQRNGGRSLELLHEHSQQTTWSRGAGTLVKGATLHLGGVYIDHQIKGGIPIPDGASLLSGFSPTTRISPAVSASTARITNP